jgi:N-acetylmuramoyl-L-alanine amidase
MNLERHPSPNFGPRREGAAIDMIVLHYTGMESADAAVAWLCSPQSQVSCHYLVHEDGRIVAIVDEAARAWHAGVSSWEGETDINSRSIGIEIANPGHQFGYPDFPRAQIAAVIELCRDIIARRGIRPERVLAHSDVAPGRKIDPGEKFPWAALAGAGVGLWAEPQHAQAGEDALMKGDHGVAVARLRTMLHRFGYALPLNDAFDGPLEVVVAAFQAHYRQRRVDGIADGETVAVLDHLLNKLGRTG